MPLVPSDGMASKRERAGEAEVKECRFCFGDGSDGLLVQPCACCGTAKWIHKHCLEKWRRMGPREDAAHRCGQCLDEYRDALSIPKLPYRAAADASNVATRCDSHSHS